MRGKAAEVPGPAASLSYFGVLLYFGSTVAREKL
jgi:hypothetical protein